MSAPDEIKVGDEVEVQYSKDGEWWRDGHIVGAVVGEYYILSLGNCEPRVACKHTVRKPAPEPVVVEVVRYGHVNQFWEQARITPAFYNPFPLGFYRGLNDTHKITFNIIDGVPDLTSIKMEEL